METFMHQLKLRSHLQRCKMCVFKKKQKQKKTKTFNSIKLLLRRQRPWGRMTDDTGCERKSPWHSSQTFTDIHVLRSRRRRTRHMHGSVCRKYRECITGKGSGNDPSTCAFMEKTGLTVKEFLEAYQLKFKSGYFWNSKWCIWLSKSFRNWTVWY